MLTCVLELLTSLSIARQNHILGKSCNLLFIIETDQCWYNLVGEDKVLDGGGDEDEDEEERDILDPAPLDDLPEPGAVGETLLRISEGGGHREVVAVRPRGPHTVLVRQLYCQVSTFHFKHFYLEQSPRSPLRILFQYCCHVEILRHL